MTSSGPEESGAGSSEAPFEPFFLRFLEKVEPIPDALVPPEPPADASRDDSEG